jgi:hypothetical protein
MRRLRWPALGLLAVLIIGLLAAAATHPLGARFALGMWPVPNGTPWSYQLESGFIPALTVVGLSTLIAGAWRHLNCHTDSCARIGRFPVAGGAFKVCSKHHREITGHPSKLTIDVLRAAHRVHLENQNRITPP